MDDHKITEFENFVNRIQTSRYIHARTESTWQVRKRAIEIKAGIKRDEGGGTRRSEKQTEFGWIR